MPYRNNDLLLWFSYSHLTALPVAVERKDANPVAIKITEALTLVSFYYSSHLWTK